MGIKEIRNYRLGKRNLLSLMKQIIKNIINTVTPKWLKAVYRDAKIIAKKIYAFTIYKKSEKRNIFIVASPYHGNGGDIAIAIAQKKILQDNFPNDNIYDVDGKEYFIHYKAIKRICKPKDLFTFIGGGNFGNQYMLEESTRRHLVEHFPNNKIVMFPQSIYYVNGETGEKEKRITHDIFANHNNLIMSARDKYSFEMMKEYFPEHRVILVPDIVLYLEPQNTSLNDSLSQSSLRADEIGITIQNNNNRKGALICLRKDLEGILSESQKIQIESKLKTLFSKITNTDTWVDYKKIKTERETLLNSKLREFASSELVITDRIHGMIFATITGTPCIVLSNYNHKVKGAYEWIKDFGYIKYANDVDEVLKYLDEFQGEDLENRYKNIFSPYYEQLIEVCRE